MKNSLFSRTLLSIALAAAVGAANASAQSTSQEFPTPIISNEIAGSIKARDLGDSRLTTFYFALNGDQGDLFINLVTKNFTGDIDVFTVNGQRPLTKIVVYADYAEAETGRAIYLRKPEKLLLRVQGRTPNDSEATFRLKFAGSFVAMRPDEVPAAPELPRVTGENRGGVRVNSVGTILPAPPKVEEPVAEKAREPEPEPTAKVDQIEEKKAAETAETVDPDRRRTDVVVTDPLKSEGSAPPSNRRRNASSRRRSSPARENAPKGEQAKSATDETANKTSPETESSRPDAPAFRTLSTRKRGAAAKKPAEEPKPDPLESINLIVQFKDGTTLEKKMSEVFKFGVDKGVLTVILKDGKVTRYQIVDVAKLTIE